MGAGMLLQALQGYTRYEVDVYLKLLFGIKLVDYVLLAALAMAVHVDREQQVPRPPRRRAVLRLDDGRRASSASRTGMLVYGSDPGWVVVGPERPRAVPRGTRLVQAVLGGVGAAARRAREPVLGARARARAAPAARARAAAPRAGRRCAPRRSPLTLIVVARRLRVLQHERPQRVRDARRRSPADEGRVRAAVQAVRGRARSRASYAMRMHVELYPRGARGGDRGHVPAREPRRTRPIDSLHVLPSADGRDARGALRPRRAAGGRRLRAALSRLRARASARAGRLDRDDASTSCIRPRGFRNAGAPTDVTPNGTYFDGTWLPALGYSPGREVPDEQTRREHGLPPRARGAERRRRGDARRGRRAPCSWWTSRRSIGTDPRQIAVTPGHARARVARRSGPPLLPLPHRRADPLRRRRPLGGVRGARGHGVERRRRSASTTIRRTT